MLPEKESAEKSLFEKQKLAKIAAICSQGFENSTASLAALLLVPLLGRAGQDRRRFDFSPVFMTSVLQYEDRRGFHTYRSPLLPLAF